MTRTLDVICVVSGLVVLGGSAVFAVAVWLLYAFDVDLFGVIRR